MSKIAVDKFISLVERSGLVERRKLAGLIADWKRSATVEQLDDADHLGRFLVGSGVLTHWQCHKISEGRHRGFMLGNYRLLDHLGSGGMSNVYLAEHVLMQRRVAIKVLPENLVADGSYLARFHFEGQAVAALDHPNIVRAYDLGSEGRIHYLVMEFVAGSDLEALVEQHGPLAAQLAAHYIRQAALGLQHAHRAGLIHRDMKPANLLVDRSGTVKVLDLGLARFTAEVRPAPEFAQQEQVLGTAAYFAPEQTVNSQAADARSDVYGLGCTLYYLLTGHPPFRDTTPLELIQAHRQRTAPSISDERPDVAAELIQICARMMAKAPADRFQSAQAVVEAIDSWLDREQADGRMLPQTWPTQGTDASLQDTAPGLQETARVTARELNTPHQTPATNNASKSDVIVPPPPPTPPVVPPPRTAPSGPVPIVRAQPIAPSQSALSGGSTARPTSTSLPHGVRRRRGAHAARRDAPWFAIFLSALLLGALLLIAFVVTRS